MKRIGKMGLLMCLALMLSGCGCEKNEPLVRVVEKVEVVSHHGEETITRIYTQSRKMTAVLNYLRWLRPTHGADCNPEQIPGDDYTITVTLSDGEQEVYQQKTNGYLRKNQERWKNIDPEKGIMLYEIISQMEGDDVSQIVGTGASDRPCAQYRYDFLGPSGGRSLHISISSYSDGRAQFCKSSDKSGKVSALSNRAFVRYSLEANAFSRFSPGRKLLQAFCSGRL